MRWPASTRRWSRCSAPTATKLAKARDLHTVGDLFGFLPRRYLDPATKTDFSTLRRASTPSRGHGEVGDDPPDAPAAGHDADGRP